MAWWDDLSDDELLVRLAERVPDATTNGGAVMIADLVRHRDDEDAAATITDLLGS